MKDTVLIKLNVWRCSETFTVVFAYLVLDCVCLWLQEGHCGLEGIRVGGCSATVLQGLERGNEFHTYASGTYGLETLGQTLVPESP